MGLSNGMFDTKQVGLTLEPYSIDSESERVILLTVYAGRSPFPLDIPERSRAGIPGNWKFFRRQPCRWKDYRFKAIETLVVEPDNRSSGGVGLVTTKILPGEAKEYVVTVTGTFRDGMEQVLLIKKITLPAISGKGTFSDGDKYVLVMPYSIYDKYSGHGFIVPVLDPKKFSLNTGYAKFSMNYYKPSVGKGLTQGKDVSISQSSYDISPTLGPADFAG